VDFSNEAAVSTWRGVNDVVMGGRSTGQMRFAFDVNAGGGVGVFEGVVTSAGGGGVKVCVCACVCVYVYVCVHMCICMWASLRGS